MLVRRGGFAVCAAVVGAAIAALAPQQASALQKLGPVQFSGNVQSQNLFRHPNDATDWQYIQNRNSLRLSLNYDWIQAGKFYNRYDIPFLESSKLVVLYRGVYDSIYDTTPGFIQKEDIHQHAYGGQTVFEFANARGNAAADAAAAAGDRREAARLRHFGRTVLTLDGLTKDERDLLKFENQLREMYADIKFRGIPLTIRAGRQQIVWGETDNFRMLDRANSLDLTWHLQQEIPAPAFGWDEIRRPFWMIKFLYDVGDVWRLSQNFLEWYWNPGDWYPAKQAFLPRPWGLPFLNPLTNPVDGAFIGGVCARSKLTIRSGVNRGLNYCDHLIGNTKLFQKGDWDRNPMDNSQVGVRYHALTPQGVEFTLNYFYQRWAGDDGTNYAPLRGLPNNSANRARASNLLAQGIFPAEFIAPYVHTVGMSANYSDETYTQAVFRAETIYDVGIPFFDVAKETTLDNPALPGVTKKNMWKGMIAFDRPTWIKSVNKKSTVFLTGQFFWHYLVNNPSCQGQVVANLSSEAKKKIGSCLVGGLDLPSTFRNNQDVTSNPAFRDKIRDWEALFTLAAFTFYRGGSIVPLLGIAVDPVNQWNMEPFWMVDYYITPEVALNLAQRYFVTPKGHSSPIFETWGLAGLNRDRSETSVRLTYQF
jgi:uncharacterized protein DUF1302